MKSIPASKLVSVIPGVVGAGGSPLSLNAVFGTDSIRVPLGTVPVFPDKPAVENYFGVNSQEALMAGAYFTGFSNATRLPGALYFGQYNTAAVAGYLRSGSFAGVTLTQLQALSGVLTLSVNGVSNTSAAINLAGATSFTNAAALVTTGLAAGAPGTAAVCSYDAVQQKFVITSPTTGAASTLTVATGTLSAGLKFTVATGAVLSPGALAATPAGFLNGVVAVTQNWATFTTTFEPDTATKEGFATWVSTASPAGTERFVYVGEDTDITVTQGAAPTAFGPATADLNGRVALYSTTPQTFTNPDGSTYTVGDTYGKFAAFFCGATASINWGARNGRITFAYKSNPLLVPSVVDATVGDNLIANGYNFYGAYATANQSFKFLQPGSISGQWDWADAYVAQIYLNSQFQLALLGYLAQVNAVPYNDTGYGSLRTVCRGPIAEALNNGTIVKGVKLSPSQQQAVNIAAGVDIATTLQQVGEYLQILDPGAIVRGQRGSPDMAFWYTDGGSIQKLNLASIDVQ